MCRRTMGEYAFPATPGERGGKVCFVWGLVVAEADLGCDRQKMVEGRSRGAHVAVDTVDYVLGGQVRDLRVCLGDVVRECFDKSLPLFLGLSEHRFCSGVCQRLRRGKSRRTRAPFNLNLNCRR